MSELRFGPQEPPLDIDQLSRAVQKDLRMAMDQQETFNWLVERNRRLDAIEKPLRAWVDMQSAENAHRLYQAAIDHFCIIPVIPD